MVSCNLRALFIFYFNVTCGTKAKFLFSEANSSQTCCFYPSIEHFLLKLFFFSEHNASHKYSD